jgi:hypothetical protein
MSVGKLSCFSVVSAYLEISSTSSSSALGRFMMLCPTVALLGLSDPCLTIARLYIDAPLARPIHCTSALKDLRPRGFSIGVESEAVVAGDSTKGEPKGDTEVSSNFVGTNLTGAGKHMCSGMGNRSKELITQARWSAHSQA